MKVLRNGAVLAAALLLVFSSTVAAKTFEVGPQQQFHSIGEVPWESLKAGDEVLIHWRPDPYKEKWVISCKGTKAAPVILRGIPGPAGELPIIDGNGATTRKQLDFWGDARGVIKIGGAKIPQGVRSEYVVIENLDIRSARPPYTFSNSAGQQTNYLAMAASLYVERAHHLTIRNCVLHDSGNGLFVSSSNDIASEDILVERCSIFGNGNEKSGREHNVYSEAIGLTFQFNQFGPMRANCLGNNLKDRSAGLVVRYNWIEGGDKALDLVDGEDSSLVRNHPSYRKTFVYGNVLVKTPGSHTQIVHYGGDSGRGSYYRKGTLYFYNNTVISQRKDSIALFWLATNEEQCDCRNNVIYSSLNGKMYPITDKGILHFSHNWVPENWMPPITGAHSTFNDDGSSIQGKSPGFVNPEKGDFHLSPGSPCRDAGTALSKDCLPDNDLAFEYIPNRQSAPRHKDNHLDIGAFEF